MIEKSRFLPQPIAEMKKGGFETRPYEEGLNRPAPILRATDDGQAWPFSRKRSASIAAMQPEPAAVIAWR